MLNAGHAYRPLDQRGNRCLAAHSNAPFRAANSARTCTGRSPTPRFQSGLAKCLNFVTKPQGPAESRAGFRFVRAVKDSTKAVRLIPFTFSSTQTMVLEMGRVLPLPHQRGYVDGPAASAWAPSTAYTIGDLVTYSGNKYYCHVAHYSGSAWPTSWAEYWHFLPMTGEYRSL